MITLSRIYKAVLIIVSLYMLEYFDIVLPSGNTDMFRVIIGGIAVTLAIMTLIIPKKSPEFKNQIRFANRFFIIYIPIVLLTSVVSVIWYGYKFMSTLAIVMPYFFPLFTYPLIYIFYRDKTHKKFLKKIVILVVVIMCIKAITWYLYNYRGIILFEKLLFKHSEKWVRNGVLRMDISYLFGVSLCFLLCEFFVEHKRKAIIPAVGMILFTVFITQYRFLEIVIIITVLFVYLTSTDSSRRELIRILLLATAGIMFIALGGLDAIFASFSFDNVDYGSSNKARLLTIDYFWNLMEGIQYVIGLGFLYSYSPRAAALLTRGKNLTYWMEDIGILGGFFTFGMLSFLIYGSLFFRSIKLCVTFVRNKYADRAFLTSVVGYMIVCCLMLNILDRQRLFDTAFYIAIISYIAAKDETRLRPPLKARKLKAPTK